MDYKGKIEKSLYIDIKKTLRKDKGFRCLEKNIKKEINDSKKSKKPKILFLSIADYYIDKVICLLIVIVSSIFFYPQMFMPNSLGMFEKMLDTGFGFSTTILGFLITGYAIFTTFMNKEFSLLLMINFIKKKKTNHFRQTNLYFIQPFINFFKLLKFSLGAKIFCIFYPNIENVNIYYKLVEFNVYFNIFYSIVLAMYIIYFYKAIISLRIFIFNIYHVALKIGEFSLDMENNSLNIEQLIDRYNEKFLKSKKE